MLAKTVLAVALFAVFYHVVVTLLIYTYLRRHSVPVSFLLLRVKSPGYAEQYRKLTESETGHTGPLFYHWIASINTALVAVIAGIVLVS